MKKYIIWTGVVLFLVVEIILGAQIKSDMSHIGQAKHKWHAVAGIELPLHGINKPTVMSSWYIMIFLVIVAFLATRRLKTIPGRLQSVFELFVGAFDGLCKTTLGEKKARKYLPLVATLFLFVWLSNIISIIPLGLEEPTSDLNTTLGLGIMCFVIAHLSSIRYRGIVKYIEEYFEPMITIKGFKIPNVIFMPLNVMGEVGKVVSHSFRLYGNIFGGAIIIMVISSLSHFVVLPIGLNLFFGLFVGTVQAFVFSMLALTYVAILAD